MSLWCTLLPLSRSCTIFDVIKLVIAIKFHLVLPLMACFLWNIRQASYLLEYLQEFSRRTANERALSIKNDNDLKSLYPDFVFSDSQLMTNINGFSIFVCLNTLCKLILGAILAVIVFHMFALIYFSEFSFHQFILFVCHQTTLHQLRQEL